METDKAKYKRSRTSSNRWKDGAINRQKVKACPHCNCNKIFSYKRKAKCTKCKRYREDLKFKAGEWE